MFNHASTHRHQSFIVSTSFSGSGADQWYINFNPLFRLWTHSTHRTLRRNGDASVLPRTGGMKRAYVDQTTVRNQKGWSKSLRTLWLFFFSPFIIHAFFYISYNRFRVTRTAEYSCFLWAQQNAYMNSVYQEFHGWKQNTCTEIFETFPTLNYVRKQKENIQTPH